MQFELQQVTPSLNTWQRMNRFARSRLNGVYAWAIKYASATSGTRWPSPPPHLVRVHIVRYSPGELDDDNAVGGAKALLDGLKTCGLIVDDNRTHCRLIMTQQRAAVGKMVVRLESDETDEV